MGLIDKMKTTTTEDVQETLEKVVSSNVSMQDALEELKEKSEEDANKKKLMYRP